MHGSSGLPYFHISYLNTLDAVLNKAFSFFFLGNYIHLVVTNVSFN